MGKKGKKKAEKKPPAKASPPKAAGPKSVPKMPAPPPATIRTAGFSRHRPAPLATTPTLERVLPVLGHPATVADPGLSAKDELALLEWMLLVRAIDEKLMLLQRQGRIAFF